MQKINGWCGRSRRSSGPCHHICQ